MASKAWRYSPFWQLFLLALVAAGCGGGGGSGGSGTVLEPAAAVTISGVLKYETPPPNTVPSICDGLNFNAVETRPIRGATVQIVQSSDGAVLGSTQASAAGAYSFVVASRTDVFLRVRAELKQGGAQSWDVEIRDNTSQTNGQPVLAQRALYVMESSVFNSGGIDATRNLTAKTGWGVNSYTDVRAAAPFAILDTIYSVIGMVAETDPAATFPPLDVFWSINNNSSSGTGVIDDDIASGDIGTSFYRSGFDPQLGGSISALFLLGMEGDDTEEFDDHVIAHEWGHYFEDKFSRSDSIGGAHSNGDLLDMRVAFGEGFATALSGIALEDPNYCDTLWFNGNLRGFRINIEGGNSAPAGWFSEFSIQKLVYDLWDDAIDGSDTVSMGFRPIYDVMTSQQSIVPAFTSIFTFASALIDQNPADAAFINSQLTRESITAIGIEPYGSTEGNSAGSMDALPVYTMIPTNGNAVPICSNAQFDSIGPNSTGNKLGEHRFLRMDVASAGQYSFSILTDASTINSFPPGESSDPDIYIYQNGNYVTEGTSPDENQEIFSTNLAAGSYVMDFQEWRYEDTSAPTNFPSRACFTVQVTCP